MPYTILDIIGCLRDIENKAIKLYDMIGNSGNAPEKLRTVANVLSNEEKRHIDYYNSLNERYKDDAVTLRDMAAYNKITTYLYEFEKQIKLLNAQSIKELLEFALELEMMNYRLLVNVQNVFISKKDDSEKQVYEAVGGIIKEEQKHIANLTTFVYKG